MSLTLEQPPAGADDDAPGDAEFLIGEDENLPEIDWALAPPPEIELR
jgi:hypothetical protein